MGGRILHTSTPVQQFAQSPAPSLSCSSQAAASSQTAGIGPWVGTETLLTVPFCTVPALRDCTTALYAVLWPLVFVVTCSLGPCNWGEASPGWALAPFRPSVLLPPWPVAWKGF